MNKAGTPEEISASITTLIGRILGLDDTLSETYLGALKTGLPGPEEVGKLNVYKEAPESELFELDPADRFLVELLKIFRLNERVKSMLYRVQFEEAIGSLEDDADKIYRAAKSLLNAPHFSELLKLILMLGNFMNASGHKGGAFGFKVTSINKLVDTKSATSSNRTLLHFTAKTVSQAMPETEGFLEELSSAADAYKADLGHVRAKLSDLRSSQSALATELDNYEQQDARELDPRDQFPTKMYRFKKLAGDRLDALGDTFTLAQTAVDDALAFYGEDSKSIPTTHEFFGIFKTFLTSYKKARDDNAQAAARAAKSAEQAVSPCSPLSLASFTHPSLCPGPKSSSCCCCRSRRSERQPRRRGDAQAQGGRVRVAPRGPTRSTSEPDGRGHADAAAARVVAARAGRRVGRRQRGAAPRRPPWRRRASLFRPFPS